ncbi:protein lin-54 homolog isoform X1 [Nasonia vitripennis]|uniref:CRC domain-containing protein n=1 Tax=Nasonia vitripennis TaxID=7425 RepID=A0A7M7LRN9_NASVI|nr:protein lin-54 homolog isoform X1 [Nasonia vitripennis]XP_008212732.1 protein lin-54 homolog isoform X1 [Nasonia vitripennis]XP_031779459.1 protein lin-54 homolog isoform X1 [Nasonia vitripennis]
MSVNKGQSTRTLVEPVTLGSQTLTDTELSALTLASTEGQYTSSDYETLANIEAELECMNAEEVMTTEEDNTVIMEGIETETIIPDVEMADISQEVHNEQIIYTTAHQSSQNLILQTKPTLQRVPTSSSVQIKPNVGQTSQSQSIMIVSPATGGGASQILKISHPASASPNQLQSIAQSLITGKSPDGNIVQIRSTQGGKLTTKTSGNISMGHVQSIKTVQSGKRVAQNSQQNRNVITKMILTNTQPQSGQQVLIASSPSDSQQGQTIKFLSSNTPNLGMGSPTKTITFAQAQQMGLLPTNKVQHILPSASQKQTGIIVNKLVQSTSAQPAKLTIVPNTAVKSPAKILPAPVSGQSKSNSQVGSSSKVVHQNSQKVIIRQGSLKQGTVHNSNPIIRIPANQTISPNQVHQLQVPGRQVQYVRLVSTPSSGTSNVMTVGKTKTSTTLQTVGVSQKISGQQQIVKVVPLNTGNQTLRTVAPKSSMSGTTQRLIIPASAPVGGSSKSSTVTIPASALSQLTSGQAVLSTTSNVGNIVVLPAQYLQQQADESKSKSQQSTPTLLNSSQGSQGSIGNSSGGSLSDSKTSRSFNNSDANGIRPRKPCNCTKSQCLKLYCDCFANGEFCHMCNCNNCSNNLGNEEERQRAIKSCLERNPNAFRPKIGKGRETGEDIRRHNKGCNCKRSGCLKNYCECYEAKIPCSENCKCIGCRNVEEPALHKQSLKDLAEAVEVRTAQLNLSKAKMQQISDTTFRPPAASNTGARQPFNFLTDKVVEMTCQCLMAQAEEAERNMFDDETSQKLIIEEFGRCLKEIIESAHKAEAT